MRSAATTLFGPILVFVCATSVAGATQRAEDAILGSWQLVVEKSTYHQLPPPRSEVRIYAQIPEGLQVTIRRVDANGSRHTISYVSAYDSVEYPIVGSELADTISWLPIDPDTAEATVSHAGREIATIRRVVSADGETMTITVLRPAGPSELRVYERED